MFQRWCSRDRGGGGDRRVRADADGTVERRAVDPDGCRAGFGRHPRGAGARRGGTCAGRPGHHGPGRPGRRRPEPRPSGGPRCRDRVGCTGRDGEQGVPERVERDRGCVPNHSAGRGGRHRRRRPGVDEPGTPSASRVPAGLDLRRRAGDRLSGARRPHRRLRPRVDGPFDRARQRRPRDRACGAGRGRGCQPPPGRRRRRRGGLRGGDRPRRRTAAPGRADPGGNR